MGRFVLRRTLEAIRLLFTLSLIVPSQSLPFVFRLIPVSLRIPTSAFRHHLNVPNPFYTVGFIFLR